MMVNICCRLLLLSLSLVPVFACDHSNSCADKPEFTPSILVVKYGGSASATCAVCKNDCLGRKYGLEKPLGTFEENGTKLIWTINKMTEWNTSATCYYNLNDIQCCSSLPIIVYNPLENVSIGVVNHTGPMFDNSSYTLQCTVEDVFPAHLLKVTFFQGQRVLGVFQSNYKQQDAPVTEIFTLSIVASDEDDGAEYWCQAKLELGPQKLEDPQEITSQAFTATVYYGPHLKVSGNPDPITITEGDTLQLNCSSVGNPLPSYNWVLPSAPFSHNNSILTITSAGFEHGGQYICNVKCISKVVTVNFKVQVRVNYIPYVIAGITILVALAFLGIIMGCISYYKSKRIGSYSFIDVFRFHSRQIPMSVEE